jgi:phosphate transport system substrate-binding protein
MQWSVKWNPNFKEYVESKEATPDAGGAAVSSQRMYEALEKDRYGIGWGALMHVKGNCVNPDGSRCPGYPGLKVIAVSRTPDGPAVALTADNVANRNYPLARDAYIYVNKPPGRPMDPKVREFLRFILSREGQAIIAKNGPYSPIPAGYIREQLKKLD